VGKRLRHGSLHRRGAIAAVALAAGCAYANPCFTPQSKVGDLRILGIAVDPPEAAVDLATGAVEPVRLRALIAHQGGSQGAFKVSWSVCVPGPVPICPDGTSFAADGGWTRDSQIERRVPKDLVAAALAADPLRGIAGIRVLAMLRVEGARPAAASTAIIFSSNAGRPRNHPPAMVGLRSAAGGAPLADAPYPLRLVVGHPAGLRPVLAPGALEEYDTVDFSGSPVHLQERVRYSFYSTPSLPVGRLDPNVIGPPIVAYGAGSDSEADEPPPGTPDPHDGLILVEAVRRESFNGTLWIVARDSRGAVSWLEVPVSAVEEDPECLIPPPKLNCAQLEFACL